MKDDVEKLVLMKCISDSGAEFPYPMDLTMAMRAVYPGFIEIRDNHIALEENNPLKILLLSIRLPIIPALSDYLVRCDRRPSGVSSRFFFYYNEGFVYLLPQGNMYNNSIIGLLFDSGYSRLFSDKKVDKNLTSVSLLLPIPFYVQENFREYALGSINSFCSLLFDGLSHHDIS